MFSIVFINLDNWLVEMPTMAPIGDPQDEEYNPDVDEGGRESDNIVSSVDESNAVAASLGESSKYFCG